MMTSFAANRTIVRGILTTSLVIVLHVLLLFCYIGREKVAVQNADYPNKWVTVALIRPHEPSEVVTDRAVSTSKRVSSSRLKRKRDFVIRQAAHPNAQLSERLVKENDNLTVDSGNAELQTNRVPFIDRVKSDIDKVARELARATPSGPLMRSDSAQTRLENGIASAFVGGTRGFTLDYYVSPDGVVITRKTTSSGVVCYMSGTINFRPGILHDSEKPQTVKCPPSGENWRK